MKLELGSYQVNDIAFGDHTVLENGRLLVDQRALKALVLEDDHFKGVSFHLARPGERTRIVHALDVVEPRQKVLGPGSLFPGVLSPPVTVGSGRTNRLAGTAVVTAAPPIAGEMTYFREAIIDMSGPGAGYSPFSRTLNLVVVPEEKDDLSSRDPADLEMTDVLGGSQYAQEYNLAVRVAGFKVANYLAHAARDLDPDRLEIRQLTPADASLPRVVYIAQMFGQLVYGQPLGWQPTLIHPNELMDGAVFGNSNLAACLRSASYFYLNHPVLEKLYEHHGVDLNLLGVLIYTVGGEKLWEKELVTDYAAKMLMLMGADGAILSGTGPGHTQVDPMLLYGKCERLGIKMTMLCPEMARTPEDPGFVYTVPETDAIVSTGNFEREIRLPPMDQVIGGSTLLGDESDAARGLKLALWHLYGATSTLGLSTLRGVQY